MTPSESPRFSVIIGTYNRRAYVLDALASVHAQTCPSFEVIVSVDGSTDGTLEAVRSAYPDVTVIEQPNLGRSIAVNRAALAARGDFLCFLDDDDLWHPEKLERIAEFLDQNPTCQALRHVFWYFSSDAQGHTSYATVDFLAEDFAACMRAVDGAPEPKNDFAYLDIESDSYGLLLERNRGAYSASCVRRDLYFAVGGLSPAQSSADDWSLFLNVARVTPWHTLWLPLGFQRLHGDQSSSDALAGVRILAAKGNAWLAGRPLPHRISREEHVVAMQRYARTQRDEIRAFRWQAVKLRDWRSLQQITALGDALLPRRRDRLAARLPMPLVWWSRRLTRRPLSSQIR